MDFNDIILERKSATPLHIQLESAIRRLLMDNTRPLPIRLPSERSLCESLHLNRLTVHRAYESLIAAKLFTRNSSRRLVSTPKAKSLVAGAFAIGILMPTAFSVYSELNSGAGMRYLNGVFDRAAELGYSIFLTNIPPQGTPEEKIAEFISTHLTRLIGMIHLGERSDEPDQPLQQLLDHDSMSHVFISGTSDLPHVGSVYTDFTRAAEKMLEIFEQQGMKRVGIFHEKINDSTDRIFNYSYASRTAAMRKLLSKKQCNILPEWDRETAGNINIMKNTITNTMKNSPLPDVFWCSNDALAIQVIKILRELDIKVPESVSVVGFDGIATEEGIASIGQDFKLIGSRAVDLVIEHFEKGITPANRNFTVEANFISGNSLKGS